MVHRKFPNSAVCPRPACFTAHVSLGGGFVRIPRRRPRGDFGMVVGVGRGLGPVGGAPDWRGTSWIRRLKQFGERAGPLARPLALAARHPAARPGGILLWGSLDRIGLTAPRQGLRIGRGSGWSLSRRSGDSNVASQAPTQQVLDELDLGGRIDRVQADLQMAPLNLLPEIRCEIDRVGATSLRDPSRVVATFRHRPPSPEHGERQLPPGRVQWHEQHQARVQPSMVGATHGELPIPGSVDRVRTAARRFRARR
jgi:hypothetical protein